MACEHDELLRDAGRELGLSQLRSVRGAIRGALIAWFALTGGHSTIKTTHADQGGWCTPAGCYVWADPYQESQSGGGGGSGGTTNPNCTADCGPPPEPPPPPHVLPPAQLPNLTKLLCAIDKYAEQHRRYPVLEANEWAFTNAAGQDVYSETTSTPPAGYSPVFGVTAIGSQWYGGGWSAVYAAGMINHNGSFNYVNPHTNAPGTAPGPFTAFEWAFVTLVHEVAHQNGLGSTNLDEDKADGYGYAALLSYRADHGAKCP